jgi:hypothetical protein
MSNNSSSNAKSIDVEKIMENRIRNFCVEYDVSINDLVEFINNENRISKNSMNPVKLEEKYKIIEERKVTVTFSKLKKMLRRIRIFSSSVGFNIFETPEELISGGPKEEVFVSVMLNERMGVEEIYKIVSKEKLLNTNFWENISFLSSDKNLRKEKIFSLGSAFKNDFLKDLQHGATFIPAVVKSECIFRPIISNGLIEYKFSAGDIILLKRKQEISAE